MMRQVIMTLALLTCSPAAVSGGPNASDDVWSDYRYVPTPCERGTCVSGGCLFENCAQPLSCSGGLCYFRHCHEASCEGGACVFDDTPQGNCSGGACRFKNMRRTLSEGYCDGGGCKLNGQSHPTDFAATLSE